MQPYGQHQPPPSPKKSNTKLILILVGLGVLLMGWITYASIVATREKAEAKANAVPTADVLPATITPTWCVQLKERVRGKIVAYGMAQNPNSRNFTFADSRARDIGGECMELRGQPMSPKFICYWNADAEGLQACDELR